MTMMNNNASRLYTCCAVILLSSLNYTCRTFAVDLTSMKEQLLPRLEAAFFDQVLEPVLRDAKTTKAQYSAMARWFVGDFHDDKSASVVRLRHATYLFFGTTEVISEFHSLHGEKIEADSPTVQQVLIRLPSNKSTPHIAIYAIIERSHNGSWAKSDTYLVEKRFRYEKMKWVLVFSSVQSVSEVLPDQSKDERGQTKGTQLNSRDDQ